MSALDFYLAVLAEWIGDGQAFLSEKPTLEMLCSVVRETPAYAVALASHALPEDV
jgi:hypothetical protein